MEAPHPLPNWVRNLYFLIGIIATLAYRVIVVVEDRGTIQFFWYIGTIGFIVYFLHRYQVSERRADLIRENRLAEKVTNLEGLSEEDKGVIAYIFKTLVSTKEKWNSVVIFATSVIALLIGIYFDFLR